jgi:hypothetical protein
MVGLVACGSQSSNYPKGAFLFCTPSSFNYTGDGGQGTVTPSLAAYIGTSPAFSIDIQDHGTDPLTISKVTLNAPGGGFALVPPSPAGLDGGMLTMLNPYPTTPAEAFVSFYFTPTKVGAYTASIVIDSNASVDGGEVIIPISALGVTADAGQFDEPDGG